MTPPTKAKIAGAEAVVSIAEARAVKAEAAAKRARAEANEAKRNHARLLALVQIAKWPEEIRVALLADPATWTSETLTALHRRRLVHVGMGWRSSPGRPERRLNYNGEQMRAALMVAE